MGLDKEHRHVVERIRSARTIKIVVDEYTEFALYLIMRDTEVNIQKFSHDVALAVQDFYNKNKEY